ncbi:MAG: phosphotransacetylase family protein [Chloroflexota bacterium]|nr:phosphotransacetylase family protein [Chloroflexota bacterium]
MATLYVTSTETFAGKSAVCVGLGQRFLRDGFTVGYMKPLSTTARRSGERVVDEDAEFAKRVFKLAEPGELLAPVTLTPHLVEAILSGEETTDFASKLKEAYAEVSKGKDVVILEGGSSLREGYLVNLPTPNVSKLLNAPELVVVKYKNNLQLVDDILTARTRLDDSMIGALINAVPRQLMRFVQETVKPYLESRRIKVFAILPQERLLLSISVGELTEALNGEILCCPEHGDELVEYLMVGAMSVDSALTYFRRKPNKAVITGGDRPDIQLAALETSTKCLILTGNLRPSPIILGRAEEVGVPMILVKQDTLTAVEIIERYFGKTRFHQEKKVQRFQEMLEERFDFDALYRALKLRS